MSDGSFFDINPKTTAASYKFGKQIREARLLAGISQVSVANALGMSDGTISNYELGKKEISNDAFNKILTTIKNLKREKDEQKMQAMDHVTFINNRNLLLKNLDVLLDLSAHYRDCLDNVYDLSNKGLAEPQSSLHIEAFNVFKDQYALKIKRIEQEEARIKEEERMNNLIHPYIQKAVNQYFESFNQRLQRIEESLKRSNDDQAENI